jgi:hypothetical protein
MDRETWIGVGSAAALGGVVALILLMLLQGAGVLPSAGASAARQAALEARAASDTLASVERRLTAVEAMTEGLPGLRADATAVATRIVAAELALAGAATRSDVQGVRNDLTAIRTRLDQAPPPAAAVDLAGLAARVARLEAALAGAAAPAATAPSAAPALAEPDPRIATLTARLEAAEAAVAKLNAGAPSPVAGTAAAVNAPATAYGNLRRAVDAGRPFAAELDAVAALGPNPAVAGLRPYAATGIATREALRADFSKVADAILAVTQAGDDSLFGRLVAGARGLVSIRPSGPIAGTDPTAIVSRMEAAVAAGDLAGALRERDGLPQAGQQASAEWAARAAARVSAETLLAEPVAAAAIGAVNR